MTFFLLLMFGIGLSRLAAAYSYEAHFAIANCAWHLLEPASKASIQEILGRSESYYNSFITRLCTEECTPLGEFGKWADEVRDDGDNDEAVKEYGSTSHHHYVEVPDDEISCPILRDDDNNNTCWLDYDRDCPNDDCVIGAIVTHTTNLLNTSIRDEGRHLGSRDGAKESILFLTHFFGDIHCPLHCDRRTDYGGTWIKVTWIDKDRYFCKQPHWIFTCFLCFIPIISDLLGYPCTGERMDMHRVWDREIVQKAIDEQYGGSRNTMEQDLLKYIEDTPAELKESWLACPDGTRQECVMEWANESLEAALRYSYVNIDGSEVINGTILTEPYYEKSWTITKEFMAKAVLRMAYNFNLVI